MGYEKGRMIMKYPELYDEYASLLREKAECQKDLTQLKDGYISTKTIAGNKYAYLQYRVNGKLISEYIKDDRLPEIRAELDKRAATLNQIHVIDGRLKIIEAAASILDNRLSRNLVTLRRCAALESMPVDERSISLAFARAMTALEGIPASEETEKSLSRWAAGNLSFNDSYMNTLRAYRLTEE